MKNYTPNYYRKFSCLMGSCKHTCCAGWEIDIDEDTLKVYQNISGKFGERLRKNIDCTAEGASFHLDERKRCPFLNQNGLCDLILEIGEEKLCQICADHPRFRNFYADREEIGVGLCCEAAGKLVLGWQEDVAFEMTDDGLMNDVDDEESAFLEWRDALMCIAQERSLTIYERIEKIARSAEMPLPDAAHGQWAAFLSSLERMDEDWSSQLECLKRWEATCPISCAEDYQGAERFMDVNARKIWQNSFEKLLLYLLYRHAPLALDGYGRRGYVGYVLLMWQIVHALCVMHICTTRSIELDDIVEIARLYSSEIEYSDENIDKIMNRLSW